MAASTEAGGAGYIAQFVVPRIDPKLRMAPTDLFQAAFSAFQHGRFTEAERDLRRILRKAPDHVGALNVLAITLVTLNRHVEAEPHLKAALRLQPRSDVTLYNYGLVLKTLKRPDEALLRFNEALALNPNNAETLNNRGTVFNDIRDYRAALADFDRVLGLNPRHAGAHFNRSKSLAELARYDEALSACDAALALQPDMAEAWFGRGFIFAKMRQPADAVAAYLRAHALDPALPLLEGNLLHQKMLICDWSGIDALVAAIEADLAAGKLAAEPFGWQGIATSEASLQRCAELANAAQFGRTPIQKRDERSASAGRIRIGYLAGEFREQATSLLLVGVLEQHDKAAFEIVAFDNGFDDGSVTRQRIDGAVDRMIDISAMDDVAAAAAVRAEGIDILVNLNGYFGGQRNGVFARRAAPIQVNYLGFPGTLGAAFMDYIIADAHVLPAEHRRFYSEKVAWLPHCYQANDDRRAIAAQDLTRKDCGLPPEGVVFCCFNNAYKITPIVFDSWMRILLAVEASVLWLLDDSEAAVTNLRREAEARGVDPARLVFAKRLPPAEHLARHRCADLFLDTLPYNAHTTASDALWAGLPLLTCEGGTFAGRVAASMLHALGLPELVTRDAAEFECRAIELACDPARLSVIRGKLADIRLSAPLFDTQKTTRDLEAAFRTMQDRRLAGLSPQHFAVAT